MNVALRLPRFYAPDYRRQLRDAGAFRNLTPSENVVLAALCDRANASGIAWPAAETIATQYGLGESTVREAIRRLTAHGLLGVVRHAGRVNTYRLTLPTLAAPAGDLVTLSDPSENWTPPLQNSEGPLQNSEGPLQNLDPIMTNDHKNDHDQQHDSGDPVVVVSEESPPGESTSAAPTVSGIEDDAGAIAMLAPEVVERARALGVSPAKVNRYGSDRVRWVLDALDAERARKMIGNPAGWVMSALRENWAVPSGVVQPGLPFAAAAAEAVRPPDGTRWARERGATITLEVLDVNETRVQVAGGIAVPAHRWGDWEWFTEHPGEASPDPVEVELMHEFAADDLVSDDAVVSPEKLATLARIVAWMKARQRTPAEVAAKLEAAGVTADELEAYQAVAPWLN